jgi:hypothetical protein
MESYLDFLLLSYINDDSFLNTDSCRYESWCSIFFIIRTFARLEMGRSLYDLMDYFYV